MAYDLSLIPDIPELKNIIVQGMQDLEDKSNLIVTNAHDISCCAKNLLDHERLVLVFAKSTTVIIFQLSVVSAEHINEFVHYPGNTFFLEPQEDMVLNPMLGSVLTGVNDLSRKDMVKLIHELAPKN